MSTPKAKPVLLVLLTLLYNYFFWEEKFGINLLLFSLLLILTTSYFYVEGWHRKNIWVALLFTVLSGVMVVWHNSFISKFAHLTSFCITIGFLHETRLRSVMYVLLYFCQTAWLTVPRGVPLLRKGIVTAVPQPQVLRLVPRWSKLLMVPGAFFSVFFIIFSIANPIFAELVSKMGSYMGDVLDLIFTDFSFIRLLFILLGLYLVAVVLYKWEIPNIHTQEQLQNDSIIRNRLGRRIKSLVGMITLKNERQAAIVLIISVNILLLAVNIIDIRWLWFNFDVKQAGNLSKLVHEGTYMLILSIMLSMSILIYYFRNNLNFYQGNALLKIAAYVWLVQNAVLAVSLLIRCYYYIHEYGLAYKRIGVVLFLALTFFGLFTLYQKISQRKSFYYLLRMNTWALFTMVIFMSLVNWDVLIVDHNLSHPNLRSGQVDVQFLLTCSDKTLPLLDANRDRIIHDINGEGDSSIDYLNRRIVDFTHEYKKHSWLSWNYADHQTYLYFKNKSKQ